MRSYPKSKSKEDVGKGVILAMLVVRMLVLGYYSEASKPLPLELKALSTALEC